MASNPVKIEAMNSLQFKQVQHLLHRYSTTESDFVALNRLKQLYGPLQWVSQLLPPRWQFLPSVFVAIQAHQVVGVLWLHRDGHQTHRWRIEQLILDPEHGSFEIGKLLVDYVINQYGASGIEQFSTEVHHDNEDAQSLLKEVGFRQIGRLHTFNTTTQPETPPIQHEPRIDGLREFRQRDAEGVHTLQIDSLPVTARLYLDRHVDDFKSHFIQHVQRNFSGVFYKQWVITHPSQPLFTGYLSIKTNNHQHFTIQLICSPGWQDGFDDLLQFAIYKIQQQTSRPSIQNRSFGFHDYQHKILEARGFKRVYESQLLVKDYWTRMQSKTALKAASPLLLIDGAPSTI